MFVKVKEERFKGCFEVVVDELFYVMVEERFLENIVGLDLIFRNVWRCINEERICIFGFYGLGGVGKIIFLIMINNEFMI